MAFYHLRAKIHGRSAGKSAVACAAYRSGTKIEDERQGVLHDYTKKKGVIESGIEAPEGAAAWIKDRARLWNAIEKAENRKNSQLAREFEVNLPHELTPEQRRELLLTFVKDELVKRGMVADWAMHEPNRRGDQRAIHAHITTATRTVNAEGIGPKVREWNRREVLIEIREAWARHANLALEKAGYAERIDHRTLEAQGIDREPIQTKGVKLTNMERTEKWRAAALEINERRQKERGLSEQVDGITQNEMNALKHEKNCLNILAAAAADPAYIPEARKYIDALKGAIIKNEAKLLQPEIDKEIAAAKKALAEAEKKDRAFEKNRPYPELKKGFFESARDFDQRSRDAVWQWQNDRREIAEAVSSTSYTLRIASNPGLAEHRAEFFYNERPTYKPFRDAERTLGDLVDLSRDRQNERYRGIER